MYLNHSVQLQKSLFFYIHEIEHKIYYNHDKGQNRNFLTYILSVLSLTFSSDIEVP
jgi:hypothetical protein